MTSGIRRAAGGLSILESVWLVYTQFVFVAAGPSCALNPCGPQINPGYSPALIGLAVILLVDGLIGIWGTWVAYPAGALLSATLLLTVGYSAWIQSGYSYFVDQYFQDLIGVALAAIGLLVNLVAWRTKYALSEQANPMNLPVFG